MNEGDFDLEQYKALRSEILRSMEDGNQIMAFGLAGIGFIVSAGFSVRESVAGFVVFSALLPILSSLVLSMWFATHERTARASYFLTGIEARLKDSIVNVNAVSWEAWLRSGGPGGRSNHFLSTQLSVIGLFGILILCSLGLSVELSDQVSLPIRVAIFCVSTTILGLVFVDMRLRFIKWNNWLNTSFD